MSPATGTANIRCRAVSRWTGRVPHPYGRGDAEDYITRSRSTPQGELTLFITHESELIGGIGITQELAIGHYFKRATMIEGQFGSADWHLDRYEQLTLSDVA